MVLIRGLLFLPALCGCLLACAHVDQPIDSAVAKWIHDLVTQDTVTGPRSLSPEEWRQVSDDTVSTVQAYPGVVVYDDGGNTVVVICWDDRRETSGQLRTATTGRWRAIVLATAARRILRASRRSPSPARSARAA